MSDASSTQQHVAEKQLTTVGERSVEMLTKQLGFPLVPSGKTFERPGVRFESYPGMAHSSCPQEIDDLKAWLTEALK